MTLVLPRRIFIKGLVGLVAAPVVIRTATLMPIVVWKPTFWVEKIHWAPGTLPHEYLVCRRDDLLGVNLQSLGLWARSDRSSDTWRWEHRHHPLSSLPQHRVRIAQQPVQSIYSHAEAGSSRPA
jgi:hypothetical protein